MSSDIARLTTELALRDNLSPGLGRAMNSVNTFNRGLSTTGRGVGQLAGGLSRLATIGIAGATTAIGFAVRAAADFEASLNTINTIAQATPPQLEAIGAGIRAMSRDTGATLDDLTKGYYDLLSAGISVADAQGVLEQANLLATGSLGTTAQGVDVLTTALNAFRLPGSDAARVAEELAVAVERGKVTLDQIAPSYANVAQTASVAGIGTNEIAAAYANLTAQGVPATEVTTQMNRAILSLIAPNAELNDLQKEMGVNFAEIARDRGLVVALEQLRIGAAEAGIPLLDLLGRQEAFKFAIATTGDNLQNYNADLAAVGDSTGTLADQVGARRQGLAFQFGVLKANIKDIGITIGSALLPQLTPAIQELSEFLQLPATQAGIKGFAKDLADGVRDFIAATKSGELQPFIDGLKVLGAVAKTALDIFQSLPPGVQALLVTGAALNKLSGGALVGGASTIAGGVGGALYDRFLQRGSSPGNPMWVAGTGIGGGGPGGVVGGKGGALGALGAATIAIPIALALRELSEAGVERDAGGRITNDPVANAIRDLFTDNKGGGILDKLNLPSGGRGKGSTTPLAVHDDPGIRQAVTAHQQQQRSLYGLGLRDAAQSAQLQNNLRAIDARRASDAAQQRAQQGVGNMRLQEIAGKNFSPTVAVSVTSQVTVSASAVQAKILQQQLIVGTGPQK